DGSYTFTLINPIDDGAGSATLDLSTLVKAVDFDGNTVALVAGDFQVTVTDDAPVSSGVSLNRTVEEGPLESGNANAPRQPVGGGAGALTPLAKFGADGANATAFTLVSQTAADAWLNTLNLKSNGVAVDHTVITGTSLVAEDHNNNIVFTLTVGG